MRKKKDTRGWDTNKERMKEGNVSDKHKEYRKMATIFNQRHERIKRLESKNKEREEYWIFINDRSVLCCISIQLNEKKKGQKRWKIRLVKISKDK